MSTPISQLFKSKNATLFNKSGNIAQVVCNPGQDNDEIYFIFDRSHFITSTQETITRVTRRKPGKPHMDPVELLDALDHILVSSNMRDEDPSARPMSKSEYRYAIKQAYTLDFLAEKLTLEEALELQSKKHIRKHIETKVSQKDQRPDQSDDVFIDVPDEFWDLDERKSIEKPVQSALKPVIYLNTLESSAANRTSQQIKQEYKDIIGTPLPFKGCGDLSLVRTKILAKYPYTQELTDSLLARTFRLHSNGKNKFSITPTLIWGSPGTGKSTYIRDFLSFLDAPQAKHSVAGGGDDHFLGVSSGYSTGVPSLITRLIAKHRIINPTVIIDEIDKVPTGMNKMNNADTRLLALLEPTESVEWHEVYLNAPVNASHVNWLFTANDLSLISKPLLSRLKVLKMPEPQKEHLPTLVANIKNEIAQRDELDPIWLPQFTQADMESIASTWNDHRNLRILKKQVDRIIDIHNNEMMSNAN